MIHTGEEAILLSMTTSFRLTFVFIMASDIGKQIQEPANKLLPNKVHGGCDWRLLSQLTKLMNELANATCVCLAVLGNKYHISIHVAGSLVVLAVGNLP